MKTKINGYEVEGTVGEIRELLSMKQEVKIEHTPKKYYTPRATSRRCKAYTKKEKRMIKQMLSEGKNISTIAKTLGRTEVAIKVYRVAHKLYNNTKKKVSEKLKAVLLERNHKAKALADKLNISYIDAMKRSCQENV